MCGRYEAGQKQKIAEAFHVAVNLDDLYFSSGTAKTSALKAPSTAHPSGFASILCLIP
jgi:hypothetical protein